MSTKKIAQKKDAWLSLKNAYKRRSPCVSTQTAKRAKALNCL